MNYRNLKKAFSGALAAFMMSSPVASTLVYAESIKVTESPVIDVDDKGVTVTEKPDISVEDKGDIQVQDKPNIQVNDGDNKTDSGIAVKPDGEKPQITVNKDAETGKVEITDKKPVENKPENVKASIKFKDEKKTSFGANEDAVVHVSVENGNMDLSEIRLY